MTDIALLGAGSVARALAAAFLQAGHRVTIGARDPRRAADDWTSDQSPAFTTLEAAAENCEIAVNALPGEAAAEVLTRLVEPLRGKVLVDLANAVHTDSDGFARRLRYPGSSLAQQLQRLLPGTHVVKTLNTLGPAELMTDPTSLSTPPTAFLSGDDTDAKHTTAALLTDLGWPRDWIVDLGDVTTAQATESFILLVGPLMRAWGMAPLAFSVAH